ncbi:glycosyltransferase family 2 protein [Propionicicella superfundia]|uniref:glycosyltransferase family 2 protein n=1 Tax=Propionicicella superfundia TaxID=348582 RepID=UPI0004174DC1|nr:glycosyltransferase [Propionicicella superfundia]
MARLTFGMPVYNGERFVGSALESLQNQDVEDIRIVVSDNGSTDATAEICRAAAAADSRIDYRRYEENRGGIWNYQNVLELADTEFFSWMAADDIKLSCFASECIDALDAAGPSVVLACPRTQIIDEHGEITETLNDTRMGMDARTPHERIRNFLRAQAFHVMYGVIRQDALRRTRGTTSVLGDDVVLLVELMCQGKLEVTPSLVFHQRRHDSQVSVQGVTNTGWFTPGSRPRMSFAETRTNIGIYTGIAHSGLPLPERLRSWGVVGPAWVFPRWRAMVRDVLNFVGVSPSVGKFRARRAARAAEASQGR